MTRVKIKAFLPEGIGTGKVEYKARTVIFTDPEGNEFLIPESLIDKLHNFASTKRKEEIQNCQQPDWNEDD